MIVRQEILFTSNDNYSSFVEYFIHTNYSFIQLSVGLDILKPDSTDEFVALGLLISIALPFLVTLIAIILIIRRRCSRPVETTPYDRIYE